MARRNKKALLLPCPVRLPAWRLPAHRMRVARPRRKGLSRNRAAHRVPGRLVGACVLRALRAGGSFRRGDRRAACRPAGKPRVKGIRPEKSPPAPSRKGGRRGQVFGIRGSRSASARRAARHTSARRTPASWQAANPYCAAPRARAAAGWRTPRC